MGSLPDSDCSVESSTLWQLILRSGICGWLLWLFPLVQFVIRRERDSAEHFDIDQSALIRIGFFCICGLILSAELLFRTRFPRNVVSRPTVWFALYTLLCGCSVLWSGHPAYTAWMTFEATVFLLLMGLAIARFGADWEAAVDWILLWAIYAGVVYGLGRYLSGGISEMSLIALHGFENNIPAPLVCLALLATRRRVARYGIVAVTLLGTSSKVYLGALAGLMFPALHARNVTLRVAGLLAGLCVLLLVLAPDFEDRILGMLFPGKDVHTIASGTGRTTLWSELLEHGMETPWLGRGFAVGEMAALGAQGMRANMAHNAIVAAFMGMGAVGVVVLCIFFIDLLWLTYKAPAIGLVGPSLFASAVCIVFVSMFATGIGGRPWSAWFPGVLFTVLVSHMRTTWHKRLDLRNRTGDMKVDPARHHHLGRASVRRQRLAIVPGTRR